MKTIIKLTIETVEEVAGHTLMPNFWKKPMFVVNGKFVASSIHEHNINKKPFDLKVGEEVEVVTEPDKRFPARIWIARNK